MSNDTQVKHAGKPVSSLRRLLALHRTLGLVSALFVLILSMSGLLLQHTTQFGLAENYLDSEALLSWYGIDVPDFHVSFKAGELTASLIGQSLYINADPIKKDVPDLVGFERLGQNYVAASSNRLFIVSEQRQLVEELSRVHGVPESIAAIATNLQNTLLLRTDDGVIRADTERLVFEPYNLSSSFDDWGVQAQPDSNIVADIKSDYGSSLLSWERLVLDIHNGRILGRWGTLLMDVMAVIFMIMAGSGIWIWTRRRSGRQGGNSNS